MSIVYYGAGKTLRDNIEHFVNETGMPVCFCDLDKLKHGTVLEICGEGREILSLDEVLSRYPDCEFYLTVADQHALMCFNYLVEQGVNPERIKLFGDRVIGLGCRNLSHYLYVQSWEVRVCAHPPHSKGFRFDKQVISENDVKEKLAELEVWRNRTMDLLRENKKTECDGCSALMYGVYPKKPRVTILGVGPNFAGGTRCNAKCIYCNQKSLMNKGSDQTLSSYDIHRICSEVYDDLDHILLADGEPSILRNVDRLFSLANNKDWSLNFNTNAIIYSDLFAETLAKKNESFIAVALDSGTRKTYKAIKGADVFEKVVANLHKYKAKGCRIILKYILLPGYNDNLEDINGFIKIAKDIQVQQITLSQNFSGYKNGIPTKNADEMNMPETLFLYFTYFLARLKEECLPWDFQIEFISKHDFERLEKLR